MVKERVLAVPDTSIFIAELPEATRNIIRKDLEEHAREHHYRLEWDLKNKDYVAMSRRFRAYPLRPSPAWSGSPPRQEARQAAPGFRPPARILS